MNDPCTNTTVVIKGINGALQSINQTKCFNEFGVPKINTEINLQNILQGVQYKYWFAMLIFSAFLLVYVLFNCFVEIKSEKWQWLKPAMAEWAIIPAVFLFLIILSQVIGFGGI
jgi:hypothetical protein